MGISWFVQDEEEASTLPIIGVHCRRFPVTQMIIVGGLFS
jgi:hypothetical protein